MPGEEHRTGASPSRRIGLIAGPIAAGLVYLLLPDTMADADLSAGGRATAAVATLMAVWWLSEALPLPATALLPIALFPLLGAASIAEATRPYAHEVIFLFMGGFILGLGMERWGLHKRLALRIVLAVGTAPRRLVAGFMLATASLSMWISNTASAIILLPVGVSVVTMLRAHASGVNEDELRNFGVCLMLAIAYGASIGGIGTLIGSPPNLVLASYASSHLGCDITMVEWMAFGLPLVAVFLPLTWLYLTRIAFRVNIPEIAGGRELVRGELAALGPMTRGEKTVLAVFLFAAAGWILRPYLADWLGLPGLSDTGVAILAALLLFLLPVEPARGVRAMDWDTAKRLPWGILLLFGGGLSLAAAISANGVDRYIASAFAGMQGVPTLVVLLLVAALVIFLTELSSNTAVANTFVPILAAVGVGLGMDPMPLLIATALAASCAFMLPVATPPNAVVFSSGYVSIGQMARAGFALNLMGVVLVAIVASFAAAPICA
jgi:solute carrier family 13 (sodium-dependent dicarboxylate transporter), member 2/3/5